MVAAMKQVAVLALLLALAVVPSAQAKAPPDGFRVCGPAACVPFTQDAAEQLAINLFFGAASTLNAAPLPTPYYTLHWRWVQAGPDYTAYYIPTAGATYLLQSTDGPVATQRGWLALQTGAKTALAQTISSLAPFPTALPVRVTVGRKVVRDPAGYASLWSIGNRTGMFYLPDARWLRVRISTAVASPWAGTVWIGRHRPLLIRNDVVFKISRTLATRIRRGASLG
jgi:hypothetical protein